VLPNAAPFASKQILDTHKFPSIQILDTHKCPSIKFSRVGQGEIVGVQNLRICFPDKGLAPGGRYLLVSAICHGRAGSRSHHPLGERRW
jgi:hypothetical protein